MNKTGTRVMVTVWVRLVTRKTRATSLFAFDCRGHVSTLETHGLFNGKYSDDTEPTSSTQVDANSAAELLELTVCKAA